MKLDDEIRRRADAAVLALSIILAAALVAIVYGWYEVLK